MKLLIDNQLPLQLVAFFKQRGHDCSHVLEIGLSDASDVLVWATAERDGWIVVSKDEDFTFLANRSGANAQLIWIRLGNCRNVALMEALEKIHDHLMSALSAGNRIVEVR